jgi:hypothetical protein
LVALIDDETQENDVDSGSENFPEKPVS